MPALLPALVIVLFAGAIRAAETIPEKSRPDSPRYELQVITAKPGKLDAVHAWFRAHQDDVLARHGATNVAYLVPVGDNPNEKLFCLYKFASLPADPEWLAAKKASEEQAGGSLTNADTGVVSQFLVATDYSPLQ